MRSRHRAGVCADSWEERRVTKAGMALRGSWILASCACDGLETICRGDADVQPGVVQKRYDNWRGNSSCRTGACETCVGFLRFCMKAGISSAAGWGILSNAMSEKTQKL